MVLTDGCHALACLADFALDLAFDVGVLGIGGDLLLNELQQGMSFTNLVTYIFFTDWLL